MADTLNTLTRKHLLHPDRVHRVPYSPQRSVSWHQFGSGPPVALLHGGHGSWRHWIRNIDALAEHFTVWVPDLPGYGDSDRPSEGSHLQDLVQAVRVTLDVLIGEHSPVDLVGFSFGGLVSTHLSIQRPGVRRLALLGPAAHAGPRRPRGELRAWRDLAAQPESDELRELMRHNLWVHMLHAPTAIDPAAIALHTDACLRTRFRSKEISRAGGLRALLGQSGSRQLIAWGEHDVTADPHTLVRELAQDHPQRRLQVVPDAGHWVQYEAAPVVNRLLIDWLTAGEAS